MGTNVAMNIRVVKPPTTTRTRTSYKVVRSFLVLNVKKHHHNIKLATAGFELGTSRASLVTQRLASDKQPSAPLNATVLNKNLRPLAFICSTCCFSLTQ